MNKNKSTIEVGMLMISFGNLIFTGLTLVVAIIALKN